MVKPPHSKMTKLRIFLVIVVASAAAAFALFRGPHEQPPQPPGKLRIVSLAPSVTEILFALDLGDQIVGVTDQCNYPPAAGKIERVSGFGTPNVEKLLALGPDMVIACGLEKPELIEVLRQAGIQVVNVQKTGFIASFPSCSTPSARSARRPAARPRPKSSSPACRPNWTPWPHGSAASTMPDACGSSSRSRKAR